MDVFEEDEEWAGSGEFGEVAASVGEEGGLVGDVGGRRGPS